MAQATGFGQGRARGERLVSLCAALMLGRPVTLEELRTRFRLYADGDVDASRRRFERDKHDLRTLGVHVREVPVGDGHGYRIDTQQAVDVTWSDEEALALAALAAAVDDPTTGAALAKIAADTGDYPAEATPARIRIDAPAAPHLAEAAFEGRRVTFDYRNARNEVSDRTVEPWALATRRGLTYVTGWDVAREEPRVYRADRIRGSVRDVGEATAERPPPGDLGVPLVPDDRTDVTMRIAPERAGDALAMGATVSDPDPTTSGPLLATFTSVREETAVGWALRHRAEILAPEELTSLLEDRRARVVARHAGQPSLRPLDAGPSRRPRRASLSDERLTRLLTLPAWLETRPGVTPEEIATAFGCTVGEVRAELDLLDLVEVPSLGNVAEAEVDTDGQVRFRPLVHSPTASLTVPEVLHLLTLTDVAGAVLPPELAGTVDAIGKRLRDALPADAAGIDVEAVDQPAVSVLRDAIASEAAVAFSYRGRHDDRVANRRVAPRQLALTDGVLYVHGHDLDTREDRIFRLDRLSRIERLDGVDVPHVDDGTTTAADYVPVGDEVEVELRLTTRGSWILQLVAPVRTVDLEDGDMHALVRTDAPDWLLAHVRAAGGEAEVLRPERLRGHLTTTDRP